jgi:signal transduction histidine kinase
MSAARTPAPSPARQAALLTVGVWGVNILLLLAPMLVLGQAVPSVVLVSTALLATTGALLSAAVYRVVMRLGNANARVRYAGVALACLVCGAIAALVDVTLGDQLRRLVQPELAEPSWSGLIARFITNWFGMGWIIGLVAAIYLMLQAARSMREREQQLADARTAASEARAAATAARLAALRYQLNPHFLFNTLNAVSSAVITRRNEEAEAMLSRLAEFLRVTLSADPEGLIPLDDELATLQAYLEIESERFRERLGVEFSCPDDLRGALVPSFILQPLIENAIKHAVAHTSRTVTIRLEAARDGDDLVVLVEDDGEGTAPLARKGTGVGLQNIRQRLEALYGARGVLQATGRERGFLAMVRLPLQWTAPVRQAA